MSRPAKILFWAGGAVIVVVLGISIAAFFVLQSEWFYNKVRDRIVYEVERASGGTSQIGSFQIDWKTLTARVRGFVLHGTEPPDAPPLFRAEQIEVGLKIVSLIKKDVDIASLIVDQPRIDILIDEHGKTNIPEPKVRRTSTKSPIETILDLAVRDFRLNDGEVIYDSRTIPISVRGEDLQAHFTYNSAVPRYEGNVAFSRLNVDASRFPPVAFALNAELAMERNRLEIAKARLGMGQTSITLSGTVQDFRAPRAGLDFVADLSVPELAGPFKLPVERRGTVVIRDGHSSWSSGAGYLVTGQLTGRDLGFRRAGVNSPRAAVRADLRVSPQGLRLDGLHTTAVGGVFNGSLGLEEFERLSVAGEINGFLLSELTRVVSRPSLAWSGAVSGPVRVSGTLTGGGLRGVEVTGGFKVSPAEGSNPVQGSVELAYSQRAGTLRLGDSSIEAGDTRIDFSGTLGENLRVHLLSRDLTDLLPAIHMVSEKAPEQLPVELAAGGTAEFRGNVLGKLNAPQITGRLQLTGFVVQNQRFDRLAATFKIENDLAGVDKLSLRRGDMVAVVQGEAGLENWRLAPDSTIRASASLEKAQLGTLLAEIGRKEPVDGTLRGSVDVSGTYGSPDATIKATIQNFRAWEETFDSVRADLRVTGGRVELIAGRLQLGGARLDLVGAYDHPEDDWKNGKMHFQTSTKGFTLGQFKTVQRLGPQVQAAIGARAEGSADIVNGAFRLGSLNGEIFIRDLMFEKERVGDIRLLAASKSGQLTVQTDAVLRASKVEGNAEFRLAGDYPGKGHIRFTPLRFSTIQQLRPGQKGPLPFEGLIAGQATFEGPVLKPDNLAGQVELTELRVWPNAIGALRTTADPKELALQNDGPIVLNFRGKTLDVQRAAFTGKGTNLSASGSFSYQDKNPWNLGLKGSFDLSILEVFDREIRSSGTMTVDASLKGSIADPQVFGQVQLTAASFYHEELPNGIDNLNGSIGFDRGRATIEEMKGTTGGGAVAVTGFLGFGGEELVYRLGVNLKEVRVRYPEAVSTTLNAALNWTGTARQSLLSGTATIIRTGFNPQTDIAGLLASSARPVPTPTSPNEFLQGMQLDIHVENAPNLMLQTSYTQDLQADIDLHVRGTGTRPALLGRVTVSEGEINFFGSKYQINRGEVNFFNPVKIEPVLDIDLQTEARGVTVNITLSGTPTRMNVTYRSDPPLAPADIVALLAVGREPDAAQNLASSQIVTNQSFLATGANTLISQAIATPVSSRLQRFFGVSKLKIDPMLTGLEGTPQARLTIEQQISPNITLTYVTNLTETQQQIVRLEWDFSRQWSVVAVRDANGIFGIDFNYKKRFK